jgi:hypothetical protein
VDRVTRHYAKKILHLHLHTQDSLIHSPFREGGLGVIELRITIPHIFRSRIRKLGDAAAGDPVIVAALSSAISGRCFSAGLQQSSADGASRHWISHPPKGWSGGDWVRAVHLRTANLPTVGIPSNPVELRRCRGGLRRRRNGMPYLTGVPCGP